MTERVARLRQQSLDRKPTLSSERAELMTAFYRDAPAVSAADPPRPVVPVPDRAQGALHPPRRADRRRARPGAESDAHLPRAVLPHARGPGHPRLAREDLVRRRSARPGRLSRRGDSVLARALDAAPHVRGAARRVEAGVRGGRVHRVHGAARARPHGGGREDLREGARRPAGRHRPRAGGARRPPRPGCVRQAAAAEGHADGRGCRDHLRPPARRGGRAPGRGRERPGAQGGARADRRHLRVGARTPRAHVLGGAAVLLVRPPGRDHRAEHVGLVLPGTPRSAPLPVLQARDRGRHADARAGEGTPAVLLGEVQQPAGAAEGRRDGGRERHVHRLRQHQQRRTEGRRQRRRERRLVPDPRGHRRDAPPAAVVEHPVEQEEPRSVPEEGVRGHPQGLGPAVGLQRRHGGRGTGAPGEVGRGRAVRRHQRLRRGGRVRQGELHPHRLLQPAEGRRAHPERRLRPAHGQTDRPEDRRPGGVRDVRPVPRGVPRGSCSTSSTSRSPAATSSSGCTRR